MCMNQKINITMMAALPKLIYRVNTILIKILAGLLLMVSFFAEIDKIKIYLEIRGDPE